MADSARRIYLDNNATSPVAPEVLDAMLPYLASDFGNPSSMHREGRLARRTLESAREKTAELLDADPSQVLFTSGGTEANNLAVLGLADQPPARLITSSIEHPSVLGCFELLERRSFEVQHIPVDSCGVVRPSDLVQMLDSNTRLVSVMLVNNETGAIQPVGELGAHASRQGALVHTDAAQAVGRIPVSFRLLRVNALSLSAHKFHGPVGVGALIVDRKDRLQPLFVGGHQEMGFRPGTEPVALVVGMARALELAMEHLEEDARRIRELSHFFEQGLRTRIESVNLNGPTSGRVPNTINLRFPGVDAQAAVIALDLLGVACSTGSACSSGAPTPSRALLAMGLIEQEARSSIRFSLSRFTTREDVGRAVELISQMVLEHQELNRRVEVR